MKTVVIGLGNQGRKRLAIGLNNVVATVDPVAREAQYRSIEQVPLDAYQAALVCTPDQTKVDILSYLLANGRHVLVEKPLLSATKNDLDQLARFASASSATCYTAYNHRFEPHITRLKDIIESKKLGDVYLAKLFYGNGTANNVKQSPWRDSGNGVLSDLGSHLLDLSLFLFGGGQNLKLEPWAFKSFENQTPDYVLFGSQNRPALVLEASLLSWRNTFTVDVVGSLGSAHINGLPKWGPSTLTLRTRVFPSGKPTEEVHQVEGPDSTWEEEYRHFKELCETGDTNIADSLWINSVINELTLDIRERALS